MKLFEIVNEKYVLYVDLDGVLVDFENGFREYFGKPSNAFNDDDLWRNIGQLPNFFYNLDWKPDGLKLWANIKKYAPIILTGAPESKPSKGLSYKDQKELWVKENLGLYVKCLVVKSKDKQKYAKSNHILIDDRPKNINEWVIASGIGILHVNLQSTLKQLRDLGFK